MWEHLVTIWMKQEETFHTCFHYYDHLNITESDPPFLARCEARLSTLKSILYWYQIFEDIQF